jgi:DNA-binding NtrC family response regulator
VNAHPGYFRAAHQGTLFLDEVADLPLTVQAKLLRAIEQHEVIAVGESSPARVDVRIVAATQLPLRTKVGEQRFRADLAARLDCVTVVLPPLRQRVEEIPYLFEWFVRKHSGGQPRQRL